MLLHFPLIMEVKMERKYTLIETPDTIYECDLDCLSMLESQNVFVILMCLEFYLSYV